MGVYFNSVVSGEGDANTASPYHVWFVAADVVTIGPGVGQMGRDVAGHISAAGWFSLGDAFDIGEGSFDRWRDPIWFNFEHTLWTPVPSTDNSGNPLAIVAPRIRYWVSPGTEVRLYVYGA